MSKLIDSFGRTHNNLRISVTDRCNIRCFYCMPDGDIDFMNRAELLTFEEIDRLVRILVPLGVNKLRLTGGEPLVRRDLHKLVERLARIEGIRDIGLTTNGILFGDQAQALFDAGLRRVNISLDALDADVFKRITRRDGYEKVVESIHIARRIGFDPIKVNAVSIKGLTEDQIVPFGEFARETGVGIRFIEFMPLDADALWQRDKVLFASEILERLSNGIMPLRPVGHADPNAPATDYEFEDGVGRIGFIASVSQPFCQNCNRFRVTADGRLRNCLFSLEETDVKDLLRSGAPDEAIAAAAISCVQAKKIGHEINLASFVQPSRPMHSIGG